MVWNIFMRRRDFIALAGAAAAFPRVALGQQAAKVPQIAFLSIPMPAENMPAIQQGLRDFGYVDGKNITVDVFTAPTNSDLPTFAARAVASKPDIILCWGIPAAQAASVLTSTIPIVFTTANGDPLNSGLIASWAHPGGDITGNTLFGPDVVAKQVGIMRETLPAAKRIAVLNVPGNAANQLNADQ